jgi:hypothetical protein
MSTVPLDYVVRGLPGYPWVIVEAGLCGRAGGWNASGIGR